jgi:hypothetical protein
VFCLYRIRAIKLCVSGRLVRFCIPSICVTTAWRQREWTKTMSRSSTGGCSLITFSSMSAPFNGNLGCNNLDLSELDRRGIWDCGRTVNSAELDIIKSLTNEVSQWFFAPSNHFLTSPNFSLSTPGVFLCRPSVLYRSIIRGSELVDRLVEARASSLVVS